MGKDFMVFLKQYGVIGLAIAVIIGGKAGDLVTAFVNGLIMPLVGMILPEGGWQTWMVGPFAIGSVLGALINFLIVAWLVFIFARKVLKEDTPAKK
jgi:large conductance mechanosensitive channel